MAIARALANQPAIILADEPTGNLDVKNSALVFDLLTRLAKNNGQAVVLVTHNPEIANRCDTVRPMRDGQFISWLSRAALSSRSFSVTHSSVQLNEGGTRENLVYYQFCGGGSAVSIAVVGEPGAQFTPWASVVIR